ncbi:enoyl-CoA hydratase/isomerase family protein [Nocardia carnea]|uniref:enoyl-CoA hydratase/isomerase family protein n=1 Tax=Nocardia carnea TaxID=37328 RepID=UPI0024541268|nr:enoyl-CoA hydratase/isomerase family protein [Nocardia carnea]
MPYLERVGNVFVLSLGNEGQTDSENRFGHEWLDETHALLDTVEASSGPAALVTTATGKFFSNGLDTDWLFANLDRMHGYLDLVHGLFSRILAFPLPTVAAVNGHAFGAGAMLASSHDFRIMRADRGFWCLPEVHLGMPFTVGMNALVTGRLANQVALTAMTTGHRYGGPEAYAAGIVDETADATDLRDTAVTRAGALAANRNASLPVIKRCLHAATLAALAVPTTADNLEFAKS